MHFIKKLALSKIFNIKIYQQITFFLFLMKIKKRLNWIQLFKNNLNSKIDFYQKNDILLNLLKLEQKYYKYIRNLSFNFFKKINKNKQTYDFLHINYNQLECVLLNNRPKRNNCYNNVYSNINFVNYLY